LDRALASEAGCGRSSRPRGILFLRRKKINAELIAIRVHGRGGQGAVTSAELLAQAAIGEGKYAQAFPSFGPERRGAPVQAFIRISNQPIRIRAEVTEPTIVMVLDPGLLAIIKVTGGLGKNGTIVVNTKSPDSIPDAIRQNFRVATVDANRIAREVIGVPIVNTTMIGALLKAVEVVKLDSLDDPMKKRFGKLSEKNLAALKRAYEETQVGEVAHA
jgi:pyruvate ferredoxin oxidoreductase gamma subunit